MYPERVMDTALVTGASSGIGLELARLLAAGGCSLVLVARDAARLKQVSAELESEFGIHAAWDAVDLAQPDAAAELWTRLERAGATVDILINNAGVGATGALADQPIEIVQRMVTLNVASLTTLTRLVLPGMMSRRRGRILHVSSLAGYQPAGPWMAVYYATKSYVLSFSKGLAAELSGSGVSVTVLCPGPTATEFEGRSGADATGLYKWVPKMSARAVALAGYRGMMRGRAVVIPGLTTKVLALAGELPPRSIALAANRRLLRR